MLPGNDCAWDRKKSPRCPGLRPSRYDRHSVREFLQTRRLFVIIFALGLFAMASRNVTDPDVWWHLRTGQLILQTGHIPHADPYSFTRAGKPWVDHEWLSQVLIYSLYRAGGWIALIAAFGTVVAAALMLVFARSPGKPYLAAVVTLLGAFAAAPCWGVRPQMLTFLLAGVLLFLLERSYSQPKLLWSIPPLVLVWANLHAGYALGIGFVILFAAGDALDAAFGLLKRAELLSRFKLLAIVTLLSVAVVVINPNGASLYTYPFQTLHSSAMQSYISEWLSPDFHDPKYLPLLFMILGTLLLPAVSPRRLRPRQLLLLLVTTYAAMRSVRHVPIYVLVAAPLLSATLDAWIAAKHFSLLSASKKPLARPQAILNASILAIFLMFVVARLSYVAAHQSAVEAREYPASAVSYLRAHPVAGPLLNHYNWGGYFIWELYPEYPVFIDGRADVYGDTFMNELASTFYIQGKHWQEPLESWGIRTVVLPPDAPLVTALGRMPAWEVVYADKQAVIVIKHP